MVDYVVDGSTVLFAGESEARVQNLILLLKELKRRGATFEVYADASARHKVDDKALYEALIRKGIVIQCPAGTPADRWILERAQETGAKIVTLDQYEDWTSEFPFLAQRDWRVPFMIRGNQVMLGKLPQEVPERSGGAREDPDTEDPKPPNPGRIFSYVSAALGAGILLLACWKIVLPAVVLGSANPFHAAVFLAMAATGYHLLDKFGGAARGWLGIPLLLGGIFLLLVTLGKSQGLLVQETTPFCARMFYALSLVSAGLALMKRR